MLSDKRKNPFELLPGNKGLQNKLLSGPRSRPLKGDIPRTAGSLPLPPPWLTRLALSCFSEHGMCFRQKLVLDLFNLLVPDFKFKLIFQVLQLERGHLEQFMFQLHLFAICKNI